MGLKQRANIFQRLNYPWEGPGNRLGNYTTLLGLALLFGLLLLIACSAEPAAPPTATKDPEVAAGETQFQRHCASCHALEPDTVIVGPSLAGIAERAAERMPGLDSRQYIELSILQPEAYLVTGFENLMPSTFGKQLTGEELDALVRFLLSQRSTRR